MVRKVDDILSSLDKIYMNNPGHPETRHIPKNKDARYRYWMESGSRPLGLALDRLNHRRSKGQDDRILFVDYDDLIQSPVEVMKSVFAHIEAPPFDIDPNNIIKHVYEDDRHYGIFGNHAVHNKIIKK